jgi:hypothetical protein
MQISPSPPQPCRAMQRLAVTLTALAVAGTCWLLLAASASAAPIVTFRPSFAAGSHLGEATVWTSELTFSGSEYHGTVAPLTELVVHLPAGMGGTSSGFPVCEQATLEALGPSGCPAGSMAGPLGSISFEVEIGSELIQETGTIQAIFAPAEKLLFYIQAIAPISFEVVAAGSYVKDASPYGQALTLELPLIGTLPGGPDVSTTALTLNLGATREEGGIVVSSAIVPPSCPDGTLPWAADAVFKEEATPVAVSFTEPCPSAGSPSMTTTTPPSGSGSPDSGGGGGAGGGSGGALVPPPTAAVVPPPSGTTHAPEPLTTAQKLARALKQCKRDKPAHKRKVCEAAAKKRYKIKRHERVLRTSATSSMASASG